MNSQCHWCGKFIPDSIAYVRCGHEVCEEEEYYACDDCLEPHVKAFKILEAKAEEESS